MTRLSMIGAGAVFLIVAVALLLRADFAFYNPVRGQSAAGREEPADEAREREVLQVTISEEDLRRFHGPPSLAQISRYYGVQDTIRCSARRTFQSDDATAGQRPLGRDTVVILCLN